MYGSLYYRSLERDKTYALKISYGNFDSQMTLTNESYQELKWWIANIDKSYNVISRGQPVTTLTTDATRSGWGAV